MDAARALLDDFTKRDRLPFARSRTTHFATITIIPEQRYGEEVLPAALMFATSFSGPVRSHVCELVGIMGDQLRELFEHCEGFAGAPSLERFILAHRHSDTFYSGMQHLAPQDVQRHQALRARIEAFVDEHYAGHNAAATAVEVRGAIQDHIRNLSGFGWALEPFEPPLSSWWTLRWRSVIALAIALPFLLSVIACSIARVFCADRWLTAVALGGGLVILAISAFVVTLVLGVRRAERKQTYVSGRPPDDQVRRVAAAQGRPVINELTICGPIKEGAMRPLCMRLLLWIVGRAVEGLPLPFARLRRRLAVDIPTVATARWIAADRGRRLIFISNYTNDAEAYARDFIDVRSGAQRINATFGFGRGYPKTQWVVRGGALTDPNGFINVVTENQHPTAYWYCPYRNLSIDNIKINRQIREGLFADLAPAQAQAWLDLLGGSQGAPRAPVAPASPPPHEERLDTGDIQGLVVRGYGRLREARYLLLAVDKAEDAERARAYLRGLADRINTAKDSPTTTALQVAFTAPGLRALGVPASAQRTFSREFLEGMTDEVRAQALGDASSKLAWCDAQVHALLMVYAVDQPALSHQLEVERAALHNAFRIVDEKDARILDGQKEHFGWRDGISMPTIEGIQSARHRKNSPEAWTERPIRPGEFVLGYRNEYECYTESPTAAPADDPSGYLRLTPDGMHKDLGKNGTYLVYRELEQDVYALWKYLADQSREPGVNREAKAIALGAKMVGRWPSGAPLVESPDRDEPKRAEHNAFRYGEDPAGLRCPVGAHIRRTNPRDVLAADRDAEDSVAMVRKHQMIRRGRPFGPPITPGLDPAEILARGPDGARRGMHFICLVGHISRQFEVVQRAWIQSPNFAGLFQDGDPLTAVRRANGDNPNDRFTCPAVPVRRTYKRMPQFTTLVGGGYFFLPGISALRFIARQPS